MVHHFSAKACDNFVYHQLEEDEGGRYRWSEGCSEGGKQVREKGEGAMHGGR